MMKATASLIAVMIHAQKHEREIYNIKPGTEHEILKLGMNQQNSEHRAQNNRHVNVLASTKPASPRNTGIRMLRNCYRSRVREAPFDARTNQTRTCSYAFHPYRRGREASPHAEPTDDHPARGESLVPSAPPKPPIPSEPLPPTIPARRTHPPI